LQAPPEKDSPREVALTYLIIRLEDIEHSKLRAVAQLILQPDKGKEAFDDYMKTAFPYLTVAHARDKDAIQAQLAEEVARGPLHVSALAKPADEKKVNARRVTRAQYDAEQAAPARDATDMSRIYSRLRKNS
jgi:hypothetical protein